jgi:4-methylaminobutanoate oxidase (formaldehyde-forming)
MQKKQKGFETKLCTLVLTDDEFTQIYGGEAVYHRGKVITRVRSGGYGYTIKKNVLYAYLPIELAKPGKRVEVELIEGTYIAEVTASVLYDPKGEKLKA